MEIRKERDNTKKVPPIPRLFGTDGIRGRANEFPMTPDLVLKLGQAIGIYFKKRYHHPRILIGKDTRRSGYMLEQALSSGICSVGVDTYFLGPLPTPGIAYLTRGMRACAGIVISASHNPFQDNGIKIFSGDGYKLPDNIEVILEELAFSEKPQINLPTGNHIGRTQRIDDATGQFSVFLKEQFPKSLTLEGLTIVLDCAHGAGYKVAPKVFEELGARIILVGASPNGKNINHECGAMNPAMMARLVQEHNASLGIAIDGDADRIVLVDEHGEKLDGDEILAICGLHLLDRGRLNKNTVIATVMSNMGLDIALESKNGKVKRTRVGDRYVVETMREGAYNFGGEQSGHLIFRDCATTGDGILAGLVLLQIILEKDKTLGELRKCMSRFPQVTRSIAVDRKVPLTELPELERYIRLIESSLGRQGRVLFRYSGTENKARVMIEGGDQDEIESMISSLISRVSHCLKVPNTTQPAEP